MYISLCKKLITVSAMALLSACASDGKIHRSEAEADPFESVNRPIFEFNYQLDKYLIKPAAKGYRAITTPFIRERVNSTLSTIVEPVSAVNNLLQGEPQDAGINVSRFVVNATLGLAGMFDVAEGWGLKPQEATLNQTLAKWCVVDGPFIVLPLLGPSTPRATVGLIGDSVMDPVYLATYNDANIRDKVGYSYSIFSGIAAREAALELLDDLESNSVDYYATMRSAYLQNQSKLKCYRDKSTDEAAYDFDFGLEEEDAAFNAMEN